MKKTATTTKPKAAKKPAKAAPAVEATTTASQPKKRTRAAAKATTTETPKVAEVISTTEEIKPEPKATTKKAPKPAKEPKAAGTSKKDQVLALISRKDGATLDEIMTAMGWQKHTVRGFISILGKAGTKIESTKSEAGARTYKAA